MRRAARAAVLPVLTGVVLALVLGVVTLLLLSRTERGRARILEYTLERLGGQLNGQLNVQLLEGDLFTGARLYGITLHDPAGEVMVAADSGYLDYDLPTFFGGDVVIRRAVLYDTDMHLYRLPGDSLWNYQRVLRDTVPQDTARVPRATIIHQLQIVNGRATIRLPWEPDDNLSEREQRAQTVAAFSDTSRLMVRRVPGGILRTIRVRTPATTVGQLTIAADERGGTYLRVHEATGEIDLYRGEPLRLRSVRGELALREGVLRFTAPAIALPSSRLEGSGVVNMQGEEPRYDLLLLGHDVALRDVQWLFPTYPDSGRAEFRMWLETRPQGLLVRMRDVQATAPGTRLSGRFGFVVGDTLLFSDVRLTAEPLDVGTAERFIPLRSPVRGLEIGSLTMQSQRRVD